MTIQVIGYTRHGSLAMTEYTLSEPVMGDVEHWLKEHALDFHQILDFRTESAGEVVDWSTEVGAERFARMAMPVAECA